jgi:hypothetical protein
MHIFSTPCGEKLSFYHNLVKRWHRVSIRVLH